MVTRSLSRLIGGSLRGHRSGARIRVHPPPARPRVECIQLFSRTASLVHQQPIDCFGKCVPQTACAKRPRFQTRWRPQRMRSQKQARIAIAGQCTAHSSGRRCVRISRASEPPGAKAVQQKRQSYCTQICDDACMAPFSFSQAAERMPAAAHRQLGQ